MKSLIVSLVFILMVIAAQGQDQCRCKDKNTSCMKSAECCSSYCRDRRCTNWGEIDDERNTENPCNLTDCRTGLSCVLEQVYCKKPPCPGRVACVEKSCR